MREGDTFLLRNRSLSDHLWVVLSDPLQDVNTPMVVVSLTSYHEGDDASCIIEPGEHPFIRRRTTALYQEAIPASNDGLHTKADHGELILQGRMRSDVLDRIRRAVMKSQYVARQCKKILTDQGLTGSS